MTRQNAMRNLAAAILVIASVFASACGSSATSPTAPTTNTTAATTGTVIKTFPIPGASQEASIVVLKVDDANKTITYKAVGPAGSEAWVSVKFVGPEPPATGFGAISNGAGEKFSDAAINTASLESVFPNYSGKISQVRFMIWVAQAGTRVGVPTDRVADYVVNYQVNW